MLGGGEDARREVDDAALLKKAKPWAYEREWRLIGPRGVRHSPLELEEVVFGMRCAESVKFAVVKALEKRDRAVQFYEILEQSESFLLQKRVLETVDLFAYYPRRNRSFDHIFDDFIEREAHESPLVSG